MKTTPSMTQQATTAFAILMRASSDDRYGPPTLANGARIGSAPKGRRVELVARVLDAFSTLPPQPEPVTGLAALLP